MFVLEPGLPLATVPAFEHQRAQDVRFRLAPATGCSRRRGDSSVNWSMNRRRSSAGK